MVAAAEPYVGKYFSQDYVRRKVLRQTDTEILEQDALIEKEIADGVIPDPSAPPVEMGAEQSQEPTAGDQSAMDLGAPIMEPDLEPQGQSTEAPGISKMPKGGEI